MFGSGGFDVCIVINVRLNSNKFKEEAFHQELKISDTDTKDASIFYPQDKLILSSP